MIKSASHKTEGRGKEVRDMGGGGRKGVKSNRRRGRCIVMMKTDIRWNEEILRKEKRRKVVKYIVVGFYLYGKYEKTINIIKKLKKYDCLCSIEILND